MGAPDTVCKNKRAEPGGETGPRKSCTLVSFTCGPPPGAAGIMLYFTQRGNFRGQLYTGQAASLLIHWSTCLVTFNAVSATGYWRKIPPFKAGDRHTGGDAFQERHILLRDIKSTPQGEMVSQHHKTKSLSVYITKLR